MNKFTRSMRKLIPVVPKYLQKYTSTQIIEALKVAVRVGQDYLEAEANRDWDKVRKIGSGLDFVVRKGREGKMDEIFHGIEPVAVELASVYRKSEGNYTQNITTIKENIKEIKPLLSEIIPFVTRFVRGMEDERKVTLVNFMTQIDFLEDKNINMIIQTVMKKYKDYTSRYGRYTSLIPTNDDEDYYGDDDDDNSDRYSYY